MHVLVTADTVGGVWTYTRELVTGLAARGIRVTLVSFGGIPTATQSDVAGRPVRGNVFPHRLPSGVDAGGRRRHLRFDELSARPHPRARSRPAALEPVLLRCAGRGAAEAGGSAQRCHELEPNRTRGAAGRCMGASGIAPRWSKGWPGQACWLRPRAGCWIALNAVTDGRRAPASFTTDDPRLCSTHL